MAREQKVDLTVNPIFEDEDVSVALVELNGENVWNRNNGSDMVYEVAGGTGQFYIEGKEPFEVTLGQLITIPSGVAYRDSGERLQMYAHALPPFNMENVEFIKEQEAVKLEEQFGSLAVHETVEPEEGSIPYYPKIAFAIKENLYQAMAYIEEPVLRWKDEHGSLWIATPFEDEAVEDLSKLKKLSLRQSFVTLNNWLINRVTDDINGDVTITTYFLLNKSPIENVNGVIVKRSIMYPSEIFELDGDDEKLTRIAAIDRSESEMSEQLGVPLSDVMDLDEHKYLLGAVQMGLADQTREAIDSYHEYLANRTPEEARLERLAEISESFMFNIEYEKTAGAAWWGITLGHLLYGVKASTPEEALLLIEESEGFSVDNALAFIEPYEEETAAELNDIFGDDDNQVNRLIPFSIVGFPEDSENMTDEQQAAFDRLK